MGKNHLPMKYVYHISCDNNKQFTMTIYFIKWLSSNINEVPTKLKDIFNY